MKTPVAARSDPFDGTIYRHANHALIELLFHLLVALNYYQILLPAHPPNIFCYVQQPGTFLSNLSAGGGVMVVL